MDAALSPSPAQFDYPDAAQVYAMIVDDDAPNELIRLGLDALRGRRVDRLVFLCIADDIRNRIGWEELERLLGNGLLGNAVPYDIYIIRTRQELFQASLNMRIIHLPAQTMAVPT